MIWMDEYVVDFLYGDVTFVLAFIVSNGIMSCLPRLIDLNST
jgi:hypothetical protein